MNEFDVVVIGAGPGGIAAALTAARHGARVVLVEKSRIGGEHIWSGEVPLKALAKSAQVFHTCNQAVEFGVHLENSRLIWSAVKLRIADVRDDVRRAQREALATADVEIISGDARFEDRSTLRVAGKGGEQVLHGGKFIVATGAVDVIPAIDGLQEIGFITPERLFNLPALPRSFVVIGEGANTCVLAQTLARLGRRVTLLAPGSTLLPEEDAEIAEFMAKLLAQDGVTVHTGANVRGLTGEGERKGVSFTTGEESHTASASEILVVPAKQIDFTEMNFAVTGARWSTQGIETDEFLQAAPDMWACGGATGMPLDSTTAKAQGELAAKNAVSEKCERWNGSTRARILCTDPAIAGAGLTEEQAREKEGEAKIYRCDFSKREAAIIEGETRGFLKIVAAEDGRLLGAHVAGENAVEIIQPFIAAVNNGVRMAELTSAAQSADPSLAEMLPLPF